MKAKNHKKNKTHICFVKFGILAIQSKHTHYNTCVCVLNLNKQPKALTRKVSKLARRRLALPPGKLGSTAGVGSLAVLATTTGIPC